MLKNLIHKQYIIYGGSIVFTRGLEYLLLFFAAHHLSKESYGELEYYKKVIEVGSSVFAFGFPALIISYTKSEDSKKYFFVLSSLFVIFIATVFAIVLGVFDWLFLLVPFVFYALFFNGGIVPGYLLVKEGSSYSSYYKSLLSLLFYSVIFISIYYFDVTGYAYVIVCYLLLPLALVFILIKVWQLKLIRSMLLRYYTLFKKLIASSFTLVISNFANLMFLYTDIFVIKILSNRANIEIANFSFALNIANLLLLIPITLVQVDIEKLKLNHSYTRILSKKIAVLTIIVALCLIPFYWVITTFFITEYNNIFLLFILILCAKLIQSFSPLYGTMLVILKDFKGNLHINILCLFINLITCYFMYEAYSLYGLALASLLSLSIRQFLLMKSYSRRTHKKVK